LSTAYTPCHRQAAEQQYAGIDGAQIGIKKVMSVDKHFGVIVTVNSIGTEQSAEEQNFLSDKSPHAEFACLKLLLQTIEMVCQMLRVSMSVIIVAVSSICHCESSAKVLVREYQ